MSAVMHQAASGEDEPSGNSGESSTNISDLHSGGPRIRLHRPDEALAPTYAARFSHQGAAALDYDPWMAVLAQLGRLRLGRLFYAAFAKRGIDLLAATLLLLMLSPIILVAALSIVADSFGNPFFCQKRIGRDGRTFTLIKLRTMKPCSEQVTVAWITDENGHLRHKLRKDPRVTRVGRWLRRTSIDELPQLINIIKGDMSLIGPRPELPEIVARYEPWQHDRHLVRPGLTGWWQVSGRSDLPMHENTELDLFYVRRHSFQLDWLIALKTLRVVFKGSGAF